MYTVQCGGGLYIFPNISKYQVLMFVESQVSECHLRAGASCSPTFVPSCFAERKIIVRRIRMTLSIKLKKQNNHCFVPAQVMFVYEIEFTLKPQVFAHHKGRGKPEQSI